MAADMDEAVAAVLSLLIAGGFAGWAFWLRERDKTRRAVAEAEARKWEAQRDMTDG